MMRQSIKRTTLILIALAVSGWGDLYAAAFCPHMGFAASASRPLSVQPVKMPAGHHCHRAAHIAQIKTSAFGLLRPDRTIPEAETGPAISTDQQCESCSMSGRSTVGSAAVTEGVYSTSRPQQALATNPEVLNRPAAALPSVHSRHGAPPGNHARTHLINSVFLI
jgi:hypothetical protein